MAIMAMLTLNMEAITQVHDQVDSNTNKRRNL